MSTSSQKQTVQKPVENPCRQEYKNSLIDLTKKYTALWKKARSQGVTPEQMMRKYLEEKHLFALAEFKRVRAHKNRQKVNV
jgi:hypothetical protein